MHGYNDVLVRCEPSLDMSNSHNEKGSHVRHISMIDGFLTLLYPPPRVNRNPARQRGDGAFRYSDLLYTLYTICMMSRHYSFCVVFFYKVIQREIRYVTAIWPTLVSNTFMWTLFERKMKNILLFPCHILAQIRLRNFWEKFALF